MYNSSYAVEQFIQFEIRVFYFKITQLLNGAVKANKLNQMLSNIVFLLLIIISYRCFTSGLPSSGIVDRLFCIEACSVFLLAFNLQRTYRCCIGVRNLLPRGLSVSQLGQRSTSVGSSGSNASEQDTVPSMNSVLWHMAT